jgi:hypothetical protein
MSKLAVFALFCVLGAAVYMILIVYYPPFYTFVADIPTNIMAVVKNPSLIVSALASHWQILASGITGFAGAFTIFSKVYSKMKQTKQQAQDVLQGEMLQLNQTKTKVENELTATKTVVTDQAATLKQVQTDLSEAQTQVSTLQKQIETLIAEKNEAERIFRQKYLTEPKPPQVK